MRANFSRLWVFFVLSASLIFAQAGSAPPAFRVEEQKIRFLNSPANQLELPVVSSAHEAFSARVHLELLKANDAVLGNIDVENSVAPGSHALVIPWKAALPSDFVSDVYWYRLRYRITPDEKTNFKAEEGIVQLSQIIPDLFRIQVSTLQHPQRGSSFPVRVHVVDARTSKGVAGVEVAANIQQEEDDAHKQPTMAQKKRTDAHGDVILSFKVPADAENDFSILMTAQRGSWVNSKMIELSVNDRATATLSTDKPIYQPGQVLHMRALVFGPTNQAMARARVKFTVSGQDDGGEFEFEAISSEFGVAQADWTIPEKVRLGDYGIRVTVNDATTAFGQMRISRYELPQFTVSPSTDKSFYLPGEQPQVTVKANYLFGQSVKRAAVRMVRDHGRKWNAAKREYEDDQQDVEQGQLDATGTFTTKLNLQGDFDDLRNSDYLRYKDARFAAYVTDLSTNRTEQKHFTVRLSKDPIHIYVIGGVRSAAAPLDFFVTTAFPDGIPASVDVWISAVKADKNGDFPSDPTTVPRLPLGHFRTNKYGVGHFRAAALPHDYVGQDSSASAELVFIARDRQHKAIHTEEFSLEDTSYLRVLPVASLLRAGENVAAEVESSLGDQEIFVDLLGGGAVLAWQRIQLRHGHGHVEFEYDQKFHNKLTLVAYAARNDEDESNRFGVAQVLFPEPQDLSVAVNLERAMYKPGEPAAASFHVRSPDGRPARSALGIVIYDKAVAERVRSDQELGRYGLYFGDDRWHDYSSIAGISVSDLLNRKLTAPVPPDLELLAQAVLASAHDYIDLLLESDELGTSMAVFGDLIKQDFAGIKRALDSYRFELNREYPRSLPQLKDILKAGSIDFEALRDPWGMPYRARFPIVGTYAHVEIVSNGPDKLPDTEDDFVVYRSMWQYFAPIGYAIDKATEDYARETGNYIRDFALLAKELKSRAGLDLNTLRDPWGHPYSFNFDVAGPRYRIQVVSAGPNGVIDGPRKHSSDDIQEWTSTVRYFQRETAALDSALARHFLDTGKFPASEQELRPVLEKSGLAPQALLDPWGRPYHFTFSQGSRYSNDVDITTYSVYEGESQRVTTVTPVTQTLGFIDVVSYGPDNDAKEPFTVAEFSRVITEQSSKDLAAQLTPAAQGPSTGGTGAISGTVTDPQGAVIVGAKVTAVNVVTNRQYIATAGSDGAYLLRNVPAGRYRIEATARGFMTSVVFGVPVTSSNQTKVDVSLNVGAASETVEVMAAPQVLNTATTDFSYAAVTKNSGTQVQVQQQAFTPRVRKYFPETLLWRPELITDSSGNAQLKFPMADNITTWKMSVMASDKNGQLGLAEKELRTFQPFFIDHEPPKILTQGDQIQLPIVLRNYLSKPQSVEVKLEQSPWFSLLSAPAQRIDIPAGQDATARFTISADHSIREGKERVTAANRDTGDAVERTVGVHPDGEDVSQTAAALLAGGQSSFNFEIPTNAIPGSIDAELRIYPNLGAHVLDSLKALVARPAGCAEQITSIAFASVLVLQYLHKAGQDNPEAPGNPNADIARRARKYVTDAYQQLVHLQASNGGMPYWMDHEPDAAVTAHVVDFLAQASAFIEVDQSAIESAQKFLISKQQPEGGWLPRWYSSKPAVDVNLTALITRVLAETKDRDETKDPGVTQAIEKAMKFLEDRIAEWNDAYVVGQYALAATMTGHTDHIGKAQELLRQLAHDEGAGTYWNLEANTSPFYGWGRGGRLETTGLAVRALARMSQDEDQSSRRLVDRGLIYLLGSKDRYGIWYSTQATLNVLRAIVDALPVVAEPAHSAGPAEIWINGKVAATIQLPASSGVSGPITRNISTLLASGTNKIDVRRQNDSSPLQAQVFSTHYIHWADSQATKNTGYKIGESRALRLNVAFDHVESAMGKSIECTVEAERIGFEGYGMMLAEIGLPPGADVDRESLQKAMGNSGVSEYDVLPDRVVVYLWPKAGGSKFNFSFKPRFAMNAAAAPSILYDYYNPDAHATVAPARFVVH